MTETFVYLDHSATTPVDERVFAAMKPYFSEVYGNPSSLHRQGQLAEAAVDNARELIAGILGCGTESIFFTACATESNNLVLQGCRLHSPGRYHILSTAVEHASVIEPLRMMQADADIELTLLPLDKGGKATAAGLEGCMGDPPDLVSVIYGNNEIGTINPITQIGAFLREYPSLLHTDAVQTANFLKLRVDDLQVDFLSLSAHKFYGPKGVGILYARDPSTLEPVLLGGGQESGVRPGTHNVPLIVGAATALKLAQDECHSETGRLSPMRDWIIERVIAEIPGAYLTGDPVERLPHHVSFAFADLDSNELLAALDLQGFACSSGSACKVGDPEPSSALLSIGFTEELAKGALRITLGRGTTKKQLGEFVDTLIEVVERLRARETA